MKENHFLSVDWGTSNLRLRLVEVQTLSVLEEVKSSQGIVKTFELWNKSGGDREEFYLKFLKSQLDKFTIPISGTVKIIISGMSSSSIGIKELPYASLPFDYSGSTLHVERISNEGFPLKVLLISGVRSERDVMRGEEVQVLGLIQDLKITGFSTLVFPGTHSKHIVCNDGKVRDFKTYMTGEMFHVISEYTILKNSISKQDSNEGIDSFDEGLMRSQEDSSLLHDLFSIRASDLTHTKTKTENSYYLSGLLIGDEISALQSDTVQTIFLCAGGNLFNLYYRAFDKLGLLNKTIVIEKEVVDNSVIKGQYKVLVSSNN